jgi:hypothetical protein
LLWATPVTLLVAYLSTWAILLSPDPNRQVVQSDFVSTITAARMISAGNGAHLYELPAQLAVQKTIRTPYMGDEGDQLLPYIHTPFEALVLAPVAGLTPWALYFLWAALLILALYWSLRLLRGALPLSIARHAGLALVLASISYGPVFRSFELGQNSLLILAGMCGVYAAARRRNDALAGVYLILVALKPQALPLVLLALLVAGRWRAVAWYAGLFAIVCVAAMPVLGVGWPLQYANILIATAGWSDANGVHPGLMHNWRGFTTDLVGWIAPGLVTPLYMLLTAGTVLLVAWVWWRIRRAGVPGVEGKTQDTGSWQAFDMGWALVGLAVVLISPHLNPHDLAFLIFPAWVIGAYAVNGRTLAVPGSRWLVLLGAHYVLLSIGSSVLGNVASVPFSVAILLVALFWLVQETLNASRRKEAAQ